MKFKPDAVASWPGIGPLECSHALEVLRVANVLPESTFSDDLVEGGPNGESFRGLLSLTGSKKKTNPLQSWSQIAAKVSRLLPEEVSAASCQASACKALQVLCAVIGRQSYGRARVLGQDGKHKLAKAGKKLARVGRKDNGSRSKP